MTGYGVTGVLPDDPFHGDPPAHPEPGASRLPSRAFLGGLTLLLGISITGACLISLAIGEALPTPNTRIVEVEAGETAGVAVVDQEPQIVAARIDPMRHVTYGLLAGTMWIVAGIFIFRDQLIPTSVATVAALIASIFFALPFF